MKTLSLNDYEICKNGEIVNKKSGRKIKFDLNSKGYPRVTIAGKKYFVHKLVAEKFVPNPLKKEQVNHKNGIKTDNRVENLEWVTNQENRNHAMNFNLHLKGEACSWSKLTEKNVDFIRNNKELSKKELAEKFKVSVFTIKSVLSYKSWKK